MAGATDNWSEAYRSLIQRNLGLLSGDEQDRLKGATVSIVGIGGLGGVILETLVRSGIERFSIVDNDVYEQSNLNRQIFAFDDTVGEKKVTVAERFCRKINPAVEMRVFDRLAESNCAQILAGADVCALVLDDVKACLTVSRTARRLGITFVEGWALPFANVCTFTPQSPSFEQTYGLAEIENFPVAEIPDEQSWPLLMKILLRFGYVEGVAGYFNDETLQNLARGIAPSFAPMVWFTAVRIAIECIKVLLGWKDLALSPDFAIYDPFAHRIPRSPVPLPESRQKTLRRLFFDSDK